MSDGNFLTKFADWAKKRYYDPLAEMGQEAGQAIREKTGRDPTLGEALGVGAKAGAESLGTGLYGGANEFLAGLPDAAVKAIARAAKSDAYEKLKETRKKYALTSDIGGATGLAASMVVPAGTGLKAASVGAKAAKLGKVASALEKGAEIASGARKVGEGAGLLGRIGGAAARGALTGAEQAIPRGIATAIGEGDIGAGAKEAALGIGLGGVLGGGLQGVGEIGKGAKNLVSKFAQSQGLMRKSGDVIQPIEKKLLDYRLKGRFPDLSTANLTRAGKQYAGKLGVDKTGYMINHADEMKQALMDLSDKYGVRNTEDLKELIQGTGKVFEGAYQKAADAGLTPVNILSPALEEGGALAIFAAKHGEQGAAVVNDIIKELDSAPDIRSAKEVIDNLAKYYRSSSGAAAGKAGFEAPGLLYELKDSLDNAVMDLDPALASAKQDWKALAPLRQMVAKEEMGLASLFAGSPTQEKQGMEKIAKMAMTGGFDPATAATIAAGSVAGGALSRALPKLANFGRGEISEVLSRPEVLEKLTKGIAGIKNIAGKAGAMAGKFPEVLPKVAGAAPSIVSKIAESETQPAKGVADETQRAQASEDAAEPAQVEEAKAQVSSKWADKAAENVKLAYYQYGLDKQGLSLDDWVSAVREVTNDFDPIASAEIVFPDKAERTAFLKDYDTALQLKNVDMSAALGPGSAIPFLPPADGTKTAKAQLEDFVARLAGQDPILMDPKKRKQISAMISKISKGEGSTADKQKALLDSLQANYGVNFGRLSDLGLLGVS